MKELQTLLTLDLRCKASYHLSPATSGTRYLAQSLFCASLPEYSLPSSAVLEKSKIDNCDRILTVWPHKLMELSTQKWIEVFHSKPYMRDCYMLEKLEDGAFSKPSPQTTLRDASHIRDGFRVFRMPFRRIEFVLTNGTDRNWEDNNGENYIIDAPGRYVVEHGIRRVDDADHHECYQTVIRLNDCFIQIYFRADLWDKCYCSFQIGDGEWTIAPGREMLLLSKRQPGRYFELVVKAPRLACAFNDGGDNWDSRMKNNYLIGCPGKYNICDGTVNYISPSDEDLAKGLVSKHVGSSSINEVQPLTNT